MEVLGPAPAAPSTKEVIEKCGKYITDVMRSEQSEEADPDRIYILRQVHKNYLYYRSLQYFAPSIYAGMIDATGIAGGGNSQDWEASGAYDYNQNIYRGYCRKEVAAIGNRMPNAIAVPDNDSDEESARATRSANTAAQYIREKCNLQLQTIYLVFGLFNFGTCFWHIDFVFDGEKYGFKQPEILSAGQAPLGNASFNCPNCGAANDAQGGDPENPQPPEGGCSECQTPLDATHYQPPTMADVPQTKLGEPQPNGALEVTLHDASEVDVPLDATCINDCPWLVLSREKHKFVLMQKYGELLKDPDGTDVGQTIFDNTAAEYAEQIRSAMASPIGQPRSKRANRWTERFVWWTPAMYNGIDDQEAKQIMKDNFQKGAKVTFVRGKIVDITEEKLTDRWQECKPECAKRIMADPLGNDWIEVQDLTTNMLNQRNEIIERSNMPIAVDPTRVDIDALERRRAAGADFFPALKPPGGSLEDLFFQYPSVSFSDQIAPFQQECEQRAQSISGLTPPIFGGADEAPTARQSELAKNAALQQLQTIWTLMGKSFEQVYMKGCRLLGEYAEGILAFTPNKKKMFNRFSTLSFMVDDLKNGKFHFDFDEAVPQSWGAQKDTMMWILDKNQAILEMLGVNDPLNAFKINQLLGIPGEHIPHLDDIDKTMTVIDKLLMDKPQPGPPGPPDPTTGQPTPGDQQASIQPDWETDAAFTTSAIKAYLTVNSDLKDENPDGYQNVVLYGKACEKIANTPPPPPPVKTSMTVTAKGSDLGTAGLQAALIKEGVIPDGTQIQPILPPLKPGEVGPNGQQVPAAPQQAPLGLMPPPNGQVQ